ncbi:MAG: cytochrome c peroxidase [Acidobacteriota bacterium]
MRLPKAPLLLCLALAFLVACATVQVAPIGYRVELPLGFPPVPVPDGNPMTAEKITLGKQLFFDPALSADGSLSCASCHLPDKAFCDGEPLPLGVGGVLGVRNAPSLLNVAYQPELLWIGEEPSLEAQVEYPVIHPKEMRRDDPAEAVEDVAANPAYAVLFDQAFGDSEVTFERISQAIATYERTLIAGDSPFDRYYFANDRGALSAEALAGWDLFQNKAGCVSCHSFDRQQPFFTDFEYHNTGIGFDYEKIDLGRFYVTLMPEDRGRFKTPSLRNVEITGPYMHDGRFDTLEAVVDFYVEGGIENRFQDERIEPLDLSEDEQAALVAFLESLTSSDLRIGY